MTTQQAIEALHALPRMGQGAPGLARMQNLCDHLGNPEKELQCIHIAGTNGKGSLAAMTSSILTAAGYKTGLTISPYVVDFRERFQIDGEMIPPRTLANLTEKVLDAIDAIEAEGGEKPSLRWRSSGLLAKSAIWSCWRQALAGAATQRTSCPTSSWQPSQRLAMTTWKSWEIPLIKLPPRRLVL